MAITCRDELSDSYLGQLRKRIGSDLVLMPGAMVALRRPSDGRVLFTRRADDETWCLPAGAAEPGGSFAATAIGELKEDAGVTVAEDELREFSIHAGHEPAVENPEIVVSSADRQ